MSGAEPLESTLVSILENRPRDCEILVALSHNYADPYRLEGDVAFLRKPGARGLADLFNAAVEACRSPLIHVLAAGTSVSEGWTDGPLAHFSDPRVASVAPLVVDACDRSRLISAGVGYHPGGRRLLCTEWPQSRPASSTVPVPLGPTIQAAFYRRSALVELGQPIDPALGDHLADVDLALQLCDAGYSARVEAECRILQWFDHGGRTSHLSDARQSETLFWLYAGAHGWLRSAVAHAGVIVSEMAASFPRPRLVAQCVGRALACCDWGYYRRRAMISRHDLAAPTAELKLARIVPDAPCAAPLRDRAA